MNNENLGQEEIVFPVVYHTFHKNKDINFQLNRLHTFGFLTEADVTTSGQRIKSRESWQSVWTDLAKEFLQEERPLAAHGMQKMHP